MRIGLGIPNSLTFFKKCDNSVLAKLFDVIFKDIANLEHPEVEVPLQNTEMFGYHISKT